MRSHSNRLIAARRSPTRFSPAITVATLTLLMLASLGSMQPARAAAVGGDGPVTLSFQGNLDEGCIGDGNADFYTCGGPWLRPDSTLDAGSPPAHWETTSTTDEDFDRSLIDPNWIWELSEPTTIGGPMTVEWWGNCNVCAGDLIDASEWNIRIYADGVKKFERLRIQIPVETPGVPERLTTTVTLPNITAHE